MTAYPNPNSDLESWGVEWLRGSAQLGGLLASWSLDDMDELESMRQAWEDARAGGPLAVLGKASSVVPHRPLAIGNQKKKNRPALDCLLRHNTSCAVFAGTGSCNCDHGTNCLLGQVRLIRACACLL